MKFRIIVTTLLIILFAAGIVADAQAAPWRGYRHHHRRGWHAAYARESGTYPTDYYYRRYYRMRYEDGCRRYCPKDDGCRRCYNHSRRGDHYTYRR